MLAKNYNYRVAIVAGMRRLLQVSGGLLALTGVALSATFNFTGPEIPQSPQGFVGWVLLLIGLPAAKTGAKLGE